MPTPLLRRLDVELPVIAAPMGGGPTTPALVAAVSAAGGLGTLAAAYLTPAQIAEDAARIRALTSRPFAINLFAGGWRTEPPGDPAPMLRLLAPIHARLGIGEPVLPTVGPDPLPAQLEAVLAARPAALSFTFGIPAPDALRRLQDAGIATIGTATTLAEARLLADAGVEAIVAQGEEAGAHRGTFAHRFEEAMVPTLELVDQIARDVPLPVIASGGIMDGHDLARALDAGATAAQLGTAFLLAPEAGTSEPWRRALRAARDAGGDGTVVTRAFSGRAARGLRNAFVELVEGAGHADAILPYPHQNALTRPMRTAAASRNEPEWLSLWAGRGVVRIRELPAGTLVREIMKELAESRARAGRP
ncbi:MAG TPA: nitronate monooxygenase [Gemmatimonadales bacterium]|nr:nitronate monooxygenase [Gemmatimonadales bacterium]